MDTLQSKVVCCLKVWPHFSQRNYRFFKGFCLKHIESFLFFLQFVETVKNPFWKNEIAPIGKLMSQIDSMHNKEFLALTLPTDKLLY